MPKEYDSQKIKHEAIENDIKKLAEEIKRIKIEDEKNNLTDTEIIKRSLSALTPVHQIQNQNVPSSGPLPSYTQPFSPEIKLEIEYLLDMAFREGIVRALNKAIKSKNPLILDAFHDALAGKLYTELKNRGLL